ncbi:MAG: GNAT family acetyltransferase [Lachnospiraceae bacterium]|nr:GNAT family acetyltransferase [Lachnospiraceae bacterium]
MYETEKFSTVNIREYLAQSNDAEIGEEVLLRILSDFSCPLNPDVERFLKEQSIEFTKKNQSVTYLVISNEDGELLGYFTIAVKPITVDAGSFSNTVKRKISRVSELDEASHSYNLSAYLIAQIGKNYTNEQNKRITGKELLELAIDQVRDMQYLAGGMVIFLEAEDKEPLMKFYRDENNFKSFNTRETKSMVSESHMLVQLLKTL